VLLDAPKRRVAHAHLFDEVDRGLKVEAKVDKLPLDALTQVLFLLQHKHVVVKELLQLLVGQVDAQLLKAVELQNQRKKETDHPTAP
jgi:hypothetical protein